MTARFPADRVLVPEVMDDPRLDPALHAAALRGLARLNRASGAVGPVAGALVPVLKQALADRPVRVLDVACGGGDNARALAARLARALGRAVTVDGADLSETALNIARAAAPAAGANGPRGAFFRADAVAGPLPGARDGDEPYDAAVCTLFLHHLTAADAAAVLRNMRAAVRPGGAIVVSDLRRTRRGLALAHLACRTLSRSPVVHVDGPRSVRAAFTMREARGLAADAGLDGATVRAAWPQRWALAWVGEG